AETVTDEDGLLVLDNAEHVIDGVARLAGELTRSTPVRLLVTSRSALALPDEATVVVDPLAVTDGMGGPAVELFRTAAARHRTPATDLQDADAATIAQVCQQVDGLPLGIELAAAQLRYRTLTEVAERLDRSL